MDNIPQVVDFIKNQAGSYALSPKMSGQVAAAGAQAFCAACLGCEKGDVGLNLDYHKGLLRLKLSFMGAGPGRPYGLAPALFTQQRCRVKLESDNGKWMWTATWEVKP